jgi:UDP-N-acetylmuramoyl-L-alanyl-D-glutamate--2,6-diaminopimelate ligase
MAARSEQVSGAGCTLGELVAALDAFEPELIGDASVRVHDVEQDSRRIEPGSLFVARRGGKSDGTRFVPQALERGAAALLVARDADLGELLEGEHAPPVLRVRELSWALPHAAEAVHGRPGHALSILGITGTNGKTTTTSLVQALLGKLGVRCARIGTLGYEFEGEESGFGLTTPEADMVSRLLARARARGGTHAVMEVTSVALSQRRVDALGFAAAAFLNLTQDHLDFHGDLEAYGRAKARLFLELGPGKAVINVDDPFGVWLARHSPAPVLRVGRSSTCEVSTGGVESGPRGLSGVLRVLGHEYPVSSPLVGAHNVENVAVAVGLCAALELDVARTLAALPNIPPVPGRLERVSGEGDDCTVLVDYAHTPDALERVLAAVRAGLSGKLICVFGCGGDRDPTKRGPMGRIAGRGADFSIVTNDNPRSERPEIIADAIEQGLLEVGAQYGVQLDRAQAIERGVLRAQPGDVVLIAGKGHETYQLIGDRRLDFDDRVEARRALALRRQSLGARG